MRELWHRRRIAALRRELDVVARTPGAARDAGDAAFMHGDRAAGFHTYPRTALRPALTATYGGWYEYASDDLRGFAFVPGNRDSVTAMLLLGDAAAACGRFREARGYWERTLGKGPRASSPPYAYYPEWTSALRRLLAYRHAVDHPRDDVFCETPEMAQAHNRERQARAQNAEGRLDAAWSVLQHGEARRALQIFDSQLPYWRQHTGEGTGFADVQRGIVIAAIFARDDARAEAELRAIAGSQHEPAGDALVFAGRWDDAFAAYALQTADEPLSDGIDPVAGHGAAEARAGDLRAAMSTWALPSRGHGPSNVDDELMALIGIARARLGDWPGAEDAWLDATRMGRAVPEWQGLWNGNVTALAMLYHFRDHFARGDHAYTLRLDPGQRARRRRRHPDG